MCGEEVARSEISVTAERREKICPTCNGTGEVSVTNGDRYRAMSDREMAALIYNGISSDPCDYCVNNNDNCCGALCKGKACEEIIENWLKQPAEEEA